MMILIFEKFRKYGIGRTLFEFLEQEIRKNKDEENVDFIGLYVKTSNQPAIDFYKKMGFEVVSVKQNYYKNLEDPDAYLMKKAV